MLTIFYDMIIAWPNSLRKNTIESIAFNEPMNMLQFQYYIDFIQ